MRKTVAVFAMVMAFGLVSFPAGWAETPEDVANRISGEVMSPYCPGVTLHDCPSDAALEKRAEIEGWARAGWSEERIMAQLQADFGDNIRANPEGTKGLVAWLVPALVLAAGLFTAVLLSKRWSRDSGGTPVAVTPEEHRRVEEDLRLLRRDNFR